MSVRRDDLLRQPRRWHRAGGFWFAHHSKLQPASHTGRREKASAYPTYTHFPGGELPIDARGSSAKALDRLIETPDRPIDSRRGSTNGLPGAKQAIVPPTAAPGSLVRPSRRTPKGTGRAEHSVPHRRNKAATTSSSLAGSEPAPSAASAAASAASLIR